MLIQGHLLGESISWCISSLLCQWEAQCQSNYGDQSDQIPHWLEEEGWQFEGRPGTPRWWWRAAGLRAGGCAETGSRRAPQFQSAHPVSSRLNATTGGSGGRVGSRIHSCAMPEQQKRKKNMYKSKQVHCSPYWDVLQTHPGDVEPQAVTAEDVSADKWSFPTEGKSPNVTIGDGVTIALVKPLHLLSIFSITFTWFPFSLPD